MLLVLRRIGCGLACILMILFLMEAAVRAVLQVPMYGADSEVGYFALPNQSGHFLLNYWTFNSNSMGVENEYRVSKKFDLLLIGDSIVFGGNELDQDDKLGPGIGIQTGWDVWPIGAGSWALQNELAFVDRSKLIRNDLDAVVFVLNSGDFEKPSHWNNKFTHPLEIPDSHLVYMLNRYLGNHEVDDSKGILVKTEDLTDKWIRMKKLADVHGSRTIVVGYTDRASTDTTCNWIPKFISSSTATYCFVSAIELSESGFRDDYHPNAEGNRKLGAFIVRVLKSDSAVGADQIAR